MKRGHYTVSPRIPSVPEPRRLAPQSMFRPFPCSGRGATSRTGLRRVQSQVLNPLPQPSLSSFTRNTLPVTRGMGQRALSAAPPPGHQLPSREGSVPVQISAPAFRTRIQTPAHYFWTLQAPTREPRVRPTHAGSDHTDGGHPGGHQPPRVPAPASRAQVGGPPLHRQTAARPHIAERTPRAGRQTAAASQVTQAPVTQHPHAAGIVRAPLVQEVSAAPEADDDDDGESTGGAHDGDCPNPRQAATGLWEFIKKVGLHNSCGVVTGINALVQSGYGLAGLNRPVADISHPALLPQSLHEAKMGFQIPDGDSLLKTDLFSVGLLTVGAGTLLSLFVTQLGMNKELKQVECGGICGLVVTLVTSIFFCSYFGYLGDHSLVIWMVITALLLLYHTLRAFLAIRD